MARGRRLLLVLITVLILAEPFKAIKPVFAEEDQDPDFDDGDEPEEAGADDNDAGGDEENQDIQDYNIDEGIGDEDAVYDDEDDIEAEASDAGPTEEDDGDVIVLTERNYRDILLSTKHIMVEFYAPWCGHCKSLAPEYTKAAAIMKLENVTFAKADATREQELAEQFEVEGYPTLMLFIDGVPKTYNGPRTSDDMVSWVRKKLGPAVETLAERSAAEKVIVEQDVICVAYFESLEGPEVEAFEAAAKDDDVYYVQTTNSEVAEMFNFDGSTKRPALALLKDEEEKYLTYDGEFETEKVKKWVDNHKLPLVITFTDTTSSKIFGSDIKKQVLLFVSDEQYEEYLAMFLPAAREVRDIIFVHINTTSPDEGTQGILDYFSLEGTGPAVMGFDSRDDGRKYRTDLPLTEENIKAFAKDFASGKAKPFLKSDPPPETNDEPVTVVVGTTVDEIVLDESKDVLLEVYAPWCGHCKKLTPIYEKLGKRFSTVDSVVIAKMDGTTNEHVRVKVDGFPTLLFFPAGDKSGDPLKVEGERTLKPLTRFIKKHAKIPFTLPKRGQLKYQSREEMAEEQELSHDEEAEGVEGARDEL